MSALNEFGPSAFPHRLSRNISALYLIQAANYLFPLVAVPYLLHRLGPASFGEVAVSQSVVMLLAILVNYGYDLSATRTIAGARFGGRSLSEIYFSVIITKLAFASVCIVGLAGAYSSGLAPRITELALLQSGVLVGYALLPTWLMQGIERIMPLAVATLAGRAAATLGVFALIGSPEDSNLYAVILSGQWIISSMLATGLALRYVSPFKGPSIASLYRELRAGWKIFLSTLAHRAYTTANVAIVGLLASVLEAGYYAAAERLVLYVAALLGPIAQAAYPRSSTLANESRESMVRLGRKLLLVGAAFGLFLAISLLVFAPLLPALVGDAYRKSVSITQILALIIVPSGIGYVLSHQFILPLRMDREFGISVGFGAAIHLGGALLLTPVAGGIGMASLYVFTESFVALMLLVFLARHGIRPYSKIPVQSGRSRD